MKSKRFPDKIFSEIERALEKELKLQPHPVAAFDADGTLWNLDLGEAFFQYQIQQQFIPNLPADPWRHYRDMKSAGDPRPAYLWLAQINKGFDLKQVRAWALKHVQAIGSLPIFEEQRTLIEWLQRQGVQVFVVTASVKWSVEPGAEILGVPFEQVLGVATQTKNGIITDLQEGVITYREGKAQALLAATGGIRPFFCCGNTMGDLHLLRESSQVAMSVRSSTEGTELFETENSLLLEAQAKGWLHHSFL